MLLLLVVNIESTELSNALCVPMANQSWVKVRDFIFNF